MASSFMSPVESRNETNRNSVRMFGPEKLNKSVASQKWDRIKIVCTQPFNKVNRLLLMELVHLLHQFICKFNVLHKISFNWFLECELWIVLYHISFPTRCQWTERKRGKFVKHNFTLGLDSWGRSGTFFSPWFLTYTLIIPFCISI